MANGRPYKVEAVANWFLCYARSMNDRIDHMKLQKLMYFANGWALGVTGKPLIDERFEAWEYGPVLPSIYHQFKSFGRSPITTEAEYVDFGTGKSEVPDIPESHQDIERFLRNIWKVYGNYDGPQLSTLTHKPGTPWDQTRKSNPGRRNSDIDDDTTRRYFRDEFEKARQRKIGLPANTRSQDAVVADG